MMKIKPILFSIISLSLSSLIVSNNVQAKDDAYVRYPSISSNAVVFTSEGDLWKVANTGGQAQRLTTHLGMESNAAISPDGKWIAFSASYEGGQEAYLMPFNGGKPQRISFDNTAVTVLGWTAQEEVLINRQNSQGPAIQTVIASINTKSLKQTVFPIADANEAALDDSGSTLYFTRMGLHTRNDNAKAYRGGAYSQLWRFDVNTKQEATNLFAKDNSNNRRPMLWKNRLYFLSDRSGAYNIYSSKLDGSEIKALTKYTDWEVRNPILGDGKIAYQLGADLHILELEKGQDKEVKVALISDFDQSRQRLIKNPLNFLTNVQLAAKTESLVFTARGQMSIAGKAEQRRVDIVLPNGARAREAVFSHDDKYVYAIVDSTGENEIWRFASNGSGAGEVLTNDADTHRLNIFPSPDGKWLAHTDKRGRLWLLDIATKNNVVIDDAGKLGMGTHDDVVWAPDSKTIAVIRANTNQGREQIGLYDLTTKKLVFVTSDRYESNSPTFSTDGKWLYFLSNRQFQATNSAPWGDRNMGPYFDKRTGIFALALQSGNRFPFQADDELSRNADKFEDKPDDKSDIKVEASPEQARKISANNDSANKKNDSLIKKSSLVIMYAGLSERLYEVPVPTGNYSKLNTDDNRLYFLERDQNNRFRSNLKTLSIAKNSPQPEFFATGLRSYDLSSDRKHVYFSVSGNNGSNDFYLVDAGAKAGSDFSKTKIKIDDWSFSSDPQLEWKQMFADAWRMHRDFLYDNNMRGVPWKKIREKYSPLVERVADRTELNDVLGMMVSEVSALHSQVRAGDVRRAEPEGQVATLGAVLTRTIEGYSIDHIYRDEPELPSQRSPLNSPELDIKEGDIITAINGRSVFDVRDISDLLLNQADKKILLQVKRGSLQNRKFIVTPISLLKNINLRYADWEQNLSERVDNISKRKIGYLHLRAMGANDIASFARDFYANYSRDGLIIDVRRNNGGNIDSWIIEKLLRKAWAFWSSQGNQAFANMQQTFRGHLVVLVDELTYSDGETFAAGVKSLNLGLLIGKRTAGAGVWLSDRNSLSDNGMVRAAENAQFDAKDGRWLVEGVGVIPDMEVDNPPHSTFMGEDNQLDAAIQYLQKKLKVQPIKPLVPQAIPELK
jgi:tricorn protease